MSGIITTGNHPKLLWPGLHALYGTTYNDTKMMSSEVFDVVSSDKAYEEIQELNGFGLASVKTEAGSIVYTSTMQGPTTRFTNVTYGLGFMETEESVEDDQYKGRATNRTIALARSMRHTRETVIANVLNRGFSGSYVGGDGIQLFSTGHVTANGTQSNTLSVAADLSETALEDMMITLMNATDSTGLRISLQGMKLVIPPNLAFEAARILKSTGQSGNANNDINALKAGGYLNQIVVWPFLTDPDAWFIVTDVPQGLLVFNRRASALEKDSDFDTGNYKHKATERFVPGWADWRGVYGSEGAA